VLDSSVSQAKFNSSSKGVSSMNVKLFSVWVLFFAVATWSSVASADLVHLKSGRTVAGAVISETDDTVVVDTVVAGNRFQQIFKKSDIKEIEQTPDSIDPDLFASVESVIKVMRDKFTALSKNLAIIRKRAAELTAENARLRLALKTNGRVILPPRQPQKQPQPPPRQQPQKQGGAKASLEGAWYLAGKPGGVLRPPGPGVRIKFIANGQWSITQADPRTGRVIYHHGGTYSLLGNSYVETVKFANANTANMIRKQYRFRVAVEKDSYTQIAIGNPWTEVWKRLR
jgi:hypothetical protein